MDELSRLFEGDEGGGEGSGAAVREGKAERATPATVAVVDDDPDVREILAFNLRNRGYAVETFDNGTAGWERLARPPAPDVAILDIMMPGIGGFQLLRRIRESTHLDGLPVILLTSKSREEDITTGFEVGATYYVTKPFQPAEIFGRVRRLLEEDG